MAIAVIIIVLAALGGLFLAKAYDLKKREEAMARAHKKHLRGIEAITLQLNEKTKMLESMVERLSFDNAELSRLNEVKSKLMSSVAHDLKQPLTSIQGYTSVLVDEEEDASNKKILDNVVRSASNMTQLINDLMDASLMSSGRFKMNKQKFNYNELIEHLYNQYKPIAESQNINFMYFEIPDTIEVVADKLRITQVISNLLNNAFKFTQKGGTVELRYYTEGGNLRTAVTDNGRGIIDVDRGKIFERFQQSDDMDESLKSQGWGLGLSIASDIVAAHNGIIEVDSAGRGYGSIFWFTIPLNPEETEPRIKK